MRTIFRIQDADGRGPYKPGFSGTWCDDMGPPVPPTWMQEFPGLLRKMNDGFHYGSGCVSLAQLTKWFTPTERFRLSILGYRVVSMNVDKVLAESRNQVVFARAKPLNEEVRVFDRDPLIGLPSTENEAL